MQKQKEISVRRISCTACCITVINSAYSSCRRKTALKVKDIGDEALYAVLASATDPYGNNGGVLYKEDAEALTYVDFNNSGIFDNAKKLNHLPTLQNIVLILHRFMKVEV